LYHVTRIVCCGALYLLLFVVTGSETVAKVTGRFAVGILTSGGSVTVAAQNAAVDLATQPKASEVENATLKIVTVYSARWTAQITGAASLCQNEWNDETLESNFRITLEPSDVLRFHKS